MMIADPELLRWDVPTLGVPLPDASIKRFDVSIPDYY